MDLFISQPYKLLDTYWQNKTVKIVQKQGKLGGIRFSQFDVSLARNGHQEDVQYIKSQQLRVNIRRDKQSIWARKGIPKMYDLKRKFISYKPIANNARETEKNFQNEDIDKKFRDVVFEEVENAFLKSHRVEIIRTEKANGQNAQVSYCYELDAWVICSKNVSVLALNDEQLLAYEGDRYQYARVIGTHWFKMLSKLSKEKLSELKKELDGRTLVGEYCGNPKYQHLVKYKQVDIIWFAVVENDSRKFCLDPFRAREIVTKYGFTFVNLKSLAVCNSQRAFFKCLLALYEETSRASICDRDGGMEGTIVYFVEHFQTDGVDYVEVVGGTKLKTLEYRLMRKIREKISTFNAKAHLNESEILKKYIHQARQLFEESGCLPPFPLKYYSNILEKGMAFVKQCPLTDRDLRDRFLTLIDCLLYTTYKNIPLTRKILDDENVTSKLRHVEWTQYQGLGCDTFMVYIPVSIPAIGKTYLARKMQHHFNRLKYKFTIITSTGQLADELAKTVIQGFPETYKKHKHFVFLDVNQTDEILQRALDIMRASMPDDKHFKVIYIMDKGKYLQIDKDFYPFSLETILVCLQNSFNRRDQEGAQQQNKGLWNVSSTAFLLQKLRNFDIKKYQLSNTKEFQFPYVVCKHLSNPNRLVDLLKQLLRASVDRECRDESLLTELVQQIRKNFSFEHISEQSMENEIEELISSGFPKIPTMPIKK